MRNKEAFNVLAFGEVLWDIVGDDAYLGGAPLNFAAHVRKCGLKAGVYSSVGNDALGESTLARIASLDVDTSLIGVNQLQTGTVNVLLKDSQPTYSILENVAYDNLSISENTQRLLENYNVFYFGSLIQRTLSNRKLLFSILSNMAFEEVFFDVNLRQNFFNAQLITKSLQYATIVKLNDDEVEVLSELIFKRILSFQECVHQIMRHNEKIKLVIITAGKDGCYLYDGKAEYFNPATRIEVKDTIGAGDAFSAAFLSVYLTTGDCIRAIEVANKTGAFVATQDGAIPDYPSGLLEELRNTIDIY